MAETLKTEDEARLRSLRRLHVAIIMDGNGRWAKAHGWPRTMGHKEGIKAVRRVLEAARELPVSHLTLYSFSTENWRRPAAEVGELMRLLRYYLRHEVPRMQKEGVRLRIVGSRAELAPDIVAEIEKAEAATKDNDKLTLVLALNYGGRQEIVMAAQKLAARVASGALRPEEITLDLFGASLYTEGLPDPDLVIRTSGELRISNFLLWQSAYAEYAFPDVLWPDFEARHLREALEDFAQRERRFGA